MTILGKDKNKKDFRCFDQELPCVMCVINTKLMHEKMKDYKRVNVYCMNSAQASMKI